jgi:hypothetical protein
MLDSTSVDVTMVNLFTYRVFVTGVSKNLLYFITVLVTVFFGFSFLLLCRLVFGLVSDYS